MKRQNDEAQLCTHRDRRGGREDADIPGTGDCGEDTLYPHIRYSKIDTRGKTKYEREGETGTT
jgi:hypothetical protein